MANVCVVRTNNDEEKKELLYNEFKKNKKIADEISARQKKVELINLQIKSLQEKMSSLTFELSVLQEIKDSQKTFIAIDKKIEEYLKKLKDKGAINNWVKGISLDNESTATTVTSIKNATYTGMIIFNHNKKRGFYRVDAELSLSSVLLNMAKEYKLLFPTISDIKIIHEGKVFYSENEANLFIDSIKTKFQKYFEAEKAPIMREFKDTNNNKYKAEDFIMYDDLLIDDFEITDDMYEEESDEIPF